MTIIIIAFVGARTGTLNGTLNPTTFIRHIRIIKLINCGAFKTTLKETSKLTVTFTEAL